MRSRANVVYSIKVCFVLTSDWIEDIRTISKSHMGEDV